MSCDSASAQHCLTCTPALLRWLAEKSHSVNLQVVFASQDDVLPDAEKQGDFTVKRTLERADFWNACLAPKELKLKV